MKTTVSCNTSSLELADWARLLVERCGSYVESTFTGERNGRAVRIAGLYIRVRNDGGLHINDTRIWSSPTVFSQSLIGDWPSVVEELLPRVREVLATAVVLEKMAEI